MNNFNIPANIITVILMKFLKGAFNVFLSLFYRMCIQDIPKLFNLLKVTQHFSDILRIRS